MRALKKYYNINILWKLKPRSLIKISWVHILGCLAKDWRKLAICMKMKGTKLAFFKLFGFKVCIPEYMHPFLWNLNESPELVVHYYYLMKVEARIHYSDGNVRFANVENLRWYMHRSDAIGRFMNTTYGQSQDKNQRESLDQELNFGFKLGLLTDRRQTI